MATKLRGTGFVLDLLEPALRQPETLGWRSRGVGASTPIRKLQSQDSTQVCEKEACVLFKSFIDSGIQLTCSKYLVGSSYVTKTA